MQYVLIIHKVEKYSIWKNIFDDVSNIRKEVGEISYHVLKYDHDPHKIVHFSVWASIKDAKKSLNRQNWFIFGKMRGLNRLSLSI